MDAIRHKQAERADLGLVWGKSRESAGSRKGIFRRPGLEQPITIEAIIQGLHGPK